MTSKAWHEAHPGYRKAKGKAWYAAHREYAKAKQKAKRKAHVDEIKAYNKTYYQANKEKIYSRIKASRKANPQKTREQNRKRRALKYTTQIEPISENRVFMRDGWICQICHKRVDKKLKGPNPMSASLDHIIPLSQGGTHTYANVQLTHLGCNLSKHSNILPQGEQLRLC